MELKEFIKTALEEIVTGIKESQTLLQHTGSEICPSGVKEFSDGVRLYQVKDLANKFKGMRIVDTVSFDVNIVASSSKNKGAKLEVGLLKVGVGAKIGSDNRESQSTRISFSIPIIFPVCEDL